MRYHDIQLTGSLSITGSLIVPKGTTEERPVNAKSGSLRLNTSLGVMEIYTAESGSEWKSLQDSTPPAPSTPVVRILAWGAAGAGSQSCDGSFNGFGGAGAHIDVTAFNTLSVGDELSIYVGGGGIKNSTITTFGGGGAAGGAGGGSAGGSSYVSLNGPAALETVIAVAAGGAGGNAGALSGSAGSSGGLEGLGGASAGPGTQIAGGAAGTGGFGGGGTAATPGSFLQGGTGMGCKGSGGASGYFGGGGGNGDCGACASGAAGGGSSYVSPTIWQSVDFNARSSGSALPLAASNNPDYLTGIGVCPLSGDGGNGLVVVYVDGVKNTFGYTGAVQTLTL